MRVFSLQTKEQDILRQRPDATIAELMKHIEEDLEWHAAFVAILTELRIPNNNGWIEEADDGESLRRMRNVDWLDQKVKGTFMRLLELVEYELFIQMLKKTAVCYHMSEEFVNRITIWKAKLECCPDAFQTLLCTEGFVRSISTKQGHVKLEKLLEDFGPAKLVQLASCGGLISMLKDDVHKKKTENFLNSTPSRRTS